SEFLFFLHEYDLCGAAARRQLSTSLRSRAPQELLHGLRTAHQRLVRSLHRIARKRTREARHHAVIELANQPNVAALFSSWDVALAPFSEDPRPLERAVERLAAHRPSANPRTQRTSHQRSTRHAVASARAMIRYLEDDDLAFAHALSGLRVQILNVG